MDDLELLFFDTFSHESSEEINLDLVQFPKPVFIGEVRIIPLGARVQADFPGGVRLGATNPSQFKIEFFVNDLSKPGASTFESLGAIDYNQNGNIHLECSHIQQIPTDGLVLRGWYSTITLAVYGALTKSVVSAVEAVGASSGVGAGAPGVGQDPRPPPAAPGGPGIATAKWVQQHAQVSAEPERSEHGGYSVEGATPHYSAYPPPPPPQQQQHQATSQNYQDYNRHAGYQWPQQGCHIEGYDGNKDGYEEEGWDMRTEDKHWERTGKDSRHGPQDPQNFRTLHEEQSPEYHKRGTPEYDSGLRRGSGGGRGGDYYSGASQWENTGGGGGGGGGAWVSSPHHHHSRKRPRTPPHPAIATSPHKSDRSASVKREGSPPVPYESLSPGDVESISEGDIPETEIGEEGGAKTPPIEDEIVGGVEGGPGGTPPYQGSAAPVIPPSPPQPPPPAPHHDEPSLDAEQFEPILSDDDIGDDADHQFQDMDYDFNDYTDDPLKTFNPYSCEIPPLMSLGDPSISPAEWEERKALRGRSGGTKEGQEDLAALLSGVEQPTDNREHWLESAEQAIACLPKTLPYMSNKEDVLKKLMEWVVFGLDFDEALNQVQLGLKIRHIKAGIRLVETLANCGEVIAEQAIVETDAQNRLIEMYHRDYMALSIKLMILRSLDATLRYKSCVERFLERGKKGGTSGYQKLIEMVRGSQLARVKYAISALLQKLHLYEILTKIGGKVRESLVNPPKMEEGAVESVDFDLMTMSLEEVLKIYVEAPYTMSQPKRFMPVSSQFEIPDCSSYSNPYGAIFTYFRSTGILHSCINVLVHPATSCCPSIVAPIHELIAELLETDGGMKFLATSLETNQLIRILIGNQDESDLGNPGTNLTLGMHLAYRLQALSYIDTLDDMPPGDDDPDKLEILDALQGLFCLTLSNFGNIGKAAVVHVLSRGDNFSVLLRYFKQKSSLRRRSPARSYIADLLIMAVKHSDHIPFLHKYGSQLLDLLADAPELSELQKWLRPVDSPAAFSYDNISPVVEHLKNSIENCTSLPGEMVTAVRVLRYLGIPSHESDLAPNTFLSEYRQLKYKCVVLQLFSLDGLGHLLSILQKLCEYYEQPALHSARLAGRHGLALLAFILPAVQLVRRMLTYVISCRNTDFKDLTAVPILLQTYTLMSTIPINAQAHNDAQRVCRELGETLLAYTQPVSSETCTESEALNKSLWTLMVAEVLKFTTDLPANFIVGLSVLSEMLPLPLPLQTRAPISEEEVSRAVNSRKLWSAHLHSLSHVVADTIVAMSGSSYRPLLELLRRVCIQLADLAAPTALVVTRALVDSICDALPSEGPSSTHLLRLLNFLACLVAHGPVKSALLFLITKNSGMKNNEKYVSAMQSLINLLKASSQDSAQCQECFLSIVQSLCDAEVSLVPPPGLGVNVTNEMYLANALPAKELLVMLCTSVVEHVATGDHGLSTMLPAMRALLLLTEHDYGFYHLKVCLEKRPGALLPPLEKIASGWNNESSMCLASLSAILELVRSAASLEPPESYPLRTLVSSHAELRSALGWKGGAQSEPEHPLMAIEKHLKANAAEYETLEPLLENVTGLIRLLEEDGQKSNESVVEPVLVSAEPLLGQFAARPVYLVGDGDDVQLSTTFWLAPPSIDDHDPDLDQVGVDLIEVAKAELCDLPLADVVTQVCRHKTTPGDIEHQAPTPAKKRLTEPNTKRPFVAPMRGRGFRGVNNSCGVGSSGGGGSGGGSGNSGSVQRGDVFRSRPPNTSRPPSLHVDDFVALETCGAQPTGPTGYNKLTMRAAQDLIATRTRGGRGSRTFGIDRGGRFYTVAQTYQREAGAWDNQVLSEHGGYTLGHDLRGVEVVGSAGVVGRFCSGGGGRGGGVGGSHRAWQDTSARAIRGASTRHIRFFTR